jgi:hypothetical protein
MNVRTAIIITASALSACVQYDGTEAPRDQLSYPVGIAVHPDGNSIYVVSSNFDGSYRLNDGGTLHRIDAESLTLDNAAAVTIPSFGAGLVTSDRDDDGVVDRLFVAVRGDDALAALDLDPAGRASCAGGVDGGDCLIGELGGDPFAPLVLPRDPGIEAPTETVAVACMDGDVSLVTVRADLSESTATSARLVRGASAIAHVERTGETYVAGRFTRSIATLDWFRNVAGDIGEVLADRVFTVPMPGQISETRALVIGPDGVTGYMTMNRPDGIQVLDLSPDPEGRGRNRPLEFIDLDGAPSELAVVDEPGGLVAYVALAEEDELVAVNLSTGLVETHIDIEGLPYGVAADTTHRHRLYVTLFDANAVGVVDIDPASPTFRQVIARVE